MAPDLYCPLCLSLPHPDCVLGLLGGELSSWIAQEIMVRPYSPFVGGLESDG